MQNELNEQMRAELLPCPFCGSTNISPDEWSQNDGKTGPGCGDCGALAETAEAWNRRQHGSAAQAWVEVVNNQRDEDGNYINAHVRTLGPFDLEHIPHGTKLYPAPPVADAEGVKIKPWQERMEDKDTYKVGERVFFKRAAIERAKDAEVADLRAALSRKAFREHLKQASETVATWPAWKGGKAEQPAEDVLTWGRKKIHEEMREDVEAMGKAVWTDEMVEQVRRNADELLPKIKMGPRADQPAAEQRPLIAWLDEARSCGLPTVEAAARTMMDFYQGASPDEQPAEAQDLPPAERDEEMQRDYLPLPGGWEIQTKGNGSTFRIAHVPSGERWSVFQDRLHAPLEQLARDCRAAHLRAAGKGGSTSKAVESDDQAGLSVTGAGKGGAA